MAVEQFTRYVYVVTNAINGKQYVGQTGKPVGSRWQEHVRGASVPRRHRNALAAAIRKYGALAFTVDEVFQLCGCATQCDLDIAEAAVIARISSLAPNGYNLVDGGRGGKRSDEARAHMSAAKRNQSAETRAKISASRIGFRFSPEALARMSASQRARFQRESVSAETRQKLSIAGRGRPRTEEHSRRLAEALKGRTHSPETIGKIRATKLARKSSYPKRSVSPETRERMSKSRMGIVFSVETLAKMSAARLGKSWSEARRAAFDDRRNGAVHT